VKKEQIMEVAEIACSANDTLHNMPFPVTPDTVYAAIMAADAFSRTVKKQR
jgi:glycerol dehydrogenase